MFNDGKFKGMKPSAENEDSLIVTLQIEEIRRKTKGNEGREDIILGLTLFYDREFEG